MARSKIIMDTITQKGWEQGKAWFNCIEILVWVFSSSAT